MNTDDIKSTYNKTADWTMNKVNRGVDFLTRPHTNVLPDDKDIPKATLAETNRAENVVYGQTDRRFQSEFFSNNRATRTSILGVDKVKDGFRVNDYKRYSGATDNPRHMLEKDYELERFIKERVGAGEKAYVDLANEGTPASFRRMTDKAKTDFFRHRESEFASRSYGENYIQKNFKKDPHATINRSGGQNDTYRLEGGWTQFKQTGARGHLKRAVQFGTGAGLTSDMMNSLGMLTSHQKRVMSAPGTGAMNAISTPLMPFIGGLFTLDTMNQASENRYERQSLLDNDATAAMQATATIAAGTYGFRVAKESTHAVTSLLGIGTAGSNLGNAMKMTLGVGTGIGAALLLTEAVDTAFTIGREAARSDNAIRRLKRQLYSPDGSGDTSVMTEQLLTSRQRAFSKLSKSSLNDRGQLMGNEAMILKGII